MYIGADKIVVNDLLPVGLSLLLSLPRSELCTAAVYIQRRNCKICRSIL